MYVGCMYTAFNNDIYNNFENICTYVLYFRKQITNSNLLSRTSENNTSRTAFRSLGLLALQS